MATFTNQATLTYGDNVTTSNIVTGELLETLSITKSSLTDTYNGNEALTYVISIVNDGTNPVTNLTLTDNLGAYTFNGNTLVPLTYVPGSLNYYVGGTRQADPVVTSTNPLTITGITAPAGSNAFLAYQVTPNSFASPAAGGTITNTVTVTGDDLPAPITASTTVNAAVEAFLTVSKSLNPTTVSEGDRLTYGFVIQNFGNTAVVAGGDAVITDTFDPALTDLTVTFNGQVWTEGTQYTYDPTTGAFASLPGALTVPSATYRRDDTTGAWVVVPGTSNLTVVGTV